MKIIWLASYPKSGNTWVRFLLYNYLFGSVQDSNDINKAIPDIHVYKLPEETEANILAKTHMKWSDQHPYASQSAGFVYIVRHPRDVLLSNLNYTQLGDDNVNPEKYARDFITNLGDPRWKSLGFGSITEHVLSWAARPAMPCLMIKYEDLKLDTATCLKKILTFIAAPIDEEKVAAAVQASEFSNVKKLEEAERTEGKFSAIFGGALSTAQDRRFMNKAQHAETLDHLGEGLEELFQDHFAETLLNLQYQS